MLKNPTTQDTVYKTAQRLFRAESEWNLSRDKKIRFTIRQSSAQTFCARLSSKKRDDTSIVTPSIGSGSSIALSRAVVMSLLSRGTLTMGSPSVASPSLNDWLATEFRERVSKKRKLLAD